MKNERSYTDKHGLFSVFDDPDAPNYAFKSSQQVVPIDGYLSFAMSMWMHASIATCLRSGPNDQDNTQNPDINSQFQHNKPSQESSVGQIPAMDVPRLSNDATTLPHHNCIDIFNKVYI